MTRDIDQQLKNAWLRQLREDWRCANNSFFKNKMRLPQLTLSSSERALGSWKGGGIRCLSISIALIISRPWEDVQEVLYHEMAHQYVEEVLNIHDDRPHGTAFKALCHDHGIDGGATGDLQAWVKKRREKEESGPHKTIDKVNKLLALAQSANAHEAESAMNKAHTLLLKHNLSLLDLQSRNHYLHKQIGDVGHVSTIKSMISAILSQFFFVEAIWAFGYEAQHNKRGRILEIYGTPENIAIAEYVHHLLHHLSEGLWQSYKRQEALPGDRHRRSFIYGLLNGFYRQLDGRRIAHQSKNLVWKGDPQLHAFFKKRNPRQRRSTSRYAKSNEAAYRSGIAQGKTLVIHKGIQGKRNGVLQYLR